MCKDKDQTEVQWAFQGILNMWCVLMMRKRRPTVMRYT